jgi:VanZ family protein
MRWSKALLRWTGLAALYLFWPGVALIAWGELTPHPPDFTQFLWDKLLHFTAYFGLAAMATVILGVNRRTALALVGLVVLGGVLEVLQGFTGRDPEVLDEIANIVGVFSGFLVAWAFVSILRSLSAGLPEAAE